MRKLSYGILIIFFGIVLSCKNDSKRNTRIDTPEVTFKKEGELFFVNPDTLAQLDIEIAESSYDQQTGLMYRKSMKANRGMLFVYEQEGARPNFYMKNTYIPLDLIYINASNKIVDFNENASPMDETPLASEAPSQYVLEVNAGQVEAWKLKIGDSIIFKRMEME